MLHWRRFCAIGGWHLNPTLNPPSTCFQGRERLRLWNDVQTILNESPHYITGLLTSRVRIQRLIAIPREILESLFHYREQGRQIQCSESSCHLAVFPENYQCARWRRAWIPFAPPQWRHCRLHRRPEAGDRCCQLWSSPDECHQSDPRFQRAGFPCPQSVHIAHRNAVANPKPYGHNRNH